VSDAVGEAPDELPKVSVVIPAFNEALMLMSSLTEIYLYLQSLADRYGFEMIVVNDGSTDETGAIADAFAASRPEVLVLHHKVNFRIGQALRYGFGRSTGRYVVAFDSDLSYAPEHIGRMVDTLVAQHARVVVASPYMKGGRTSAIPWNRRVMSAGVNRILSASTQSHVATVTGMVRAYDGPFLRSLTLKAMGPEINTEILYKAQIMRARVVEVPAHLDWSGQSERLRTRKVSLKVSTTSKLLVFASFLFRPIVFFVVPGLLLLLISMWSIAALALTVLRTARVQSGGLDSRLTNAFALAWEHRPQTFIIAGFSFVVAVQMISLGVLAMQAKRYFEEIYYTLTGSRARIETIAASPSLQEPPVELIGDD
jgi:glycosyltransferase involved in cell wall biosynthesis